jgi:hypothetical protein
VKKERQTNNIMEHQNKQQRAESESNEREIRKKKREPFYQKAVRRRGKGGSKTCALITLNALL